MVIKKGYQQTEIGIIPDDWNIEKIIEFTDATSGGTPSTLKKEYWNGEIKWMNSGELNLKKIGLFSLDIDGVDYWIWKEIKEIKPIIFVCEFNSVFGNKKKNYCTL